MSGRRRSTISVGHDAFLDIVANLVGILIILVVVLGAQSQRTIREAEQQREPEQVDPIRRAAGEAEIDALAMARTHANAAQADSIRIERTIQLLDGEIRQKAEQRAVLLTLLDEAQTIWENEQAKLDEDRLAASERERKASQLAKQLTSLEGEETRLKNRKAPVVAVEHLPTPMAKTVFEKEFHFRLKDNRLSVLPLDALTKEIERDMRRMAVGSSEGVTDAAIGPVRGYVARYIVDRRNQLVSRGGSVARMARMQVMACAFEPLSEPHGEPIQNVLANDDWLDVELTGHRSDGTVITVWVYPDSYAAFRRLKEKLYAKGYATAARPMEMDRAIIASPHGSKSAAQ
ncbi:MAG: hypothetical protein AAFX06_03570 [Planctomycetota bacterium]